MGIGASAGGLDACRKLLAALPSDTGMAFILVQHLDPTHESMMVDLLSGSTTMTVKQAVHGMAPESNHLYVIPPGYYLAVRNGVLCLSHPEAPHGARMPFDFLLNSLAEEYGERAVCIVLSGTGADGSIGLKAVSERGGLVIAQDPDEAAFSGMPLSAIMTGMVRYVLPLADIPAALRKQIPRSDAAASHAYPLSDGGKEAGLSRVLYLLRARTGHNFKFYKAGTLERRIGQRMAMAGCENDADRYLELLRNDPLEIDLLAKDLLIHVTRFFRDPGVFEYLTENIIPSLLTNLAPGQPLRIWVAGCSTGEETYSLAILFREQMTLMKTSAKLQVFASDIDPEAIAHAREGLYPKTIEEDVSPARLARFFSKEERGYRVLPELRDAVLFTVQDVLADPPFSRLDLVSCRNLLIYLKPDAQAKVMSQFHFALRLGGILLLGGSETVDNDDNRFAVISKPQRVYRHVGHRRPGEFGLELSSGGNILSLVRPDSITAPSHQEVLANLCRRLVLEAYAPAAILINRKHECLYTLGPTEKYLRVARGYPTHDLLALVRRELRTKLRSAIQQATEKNSRVTVAADESRQGDNQELVSISVEPVQNEGEDLLLICFFDKPIHDAARKRPIPPEEMSRVAELERELEATRTELEGAILNLEHSSQEQKAINQEALSINEEYQSTNEELVTSKEELQSLNEELTALNSQLHETLERQRTTADDLQNILYSTNVATLFLDINLKIRFFTPETRSMLNIIAGDIGRPISDLSAMASDDDLETDSRSVIRTHVPMEREILFPDGTWYIRRILPYRTQGSGVEGVVITFTNITERKHVAEALNTSMMQADHANRAKTRFLAAASHDLRQPLQTLALLQGILARTVDDERAQKLIARLDETLSAMSGMLNALLDINEIEAGTVRADRKTFPIEELIGRLRDEFNYHALSQGLEFHAVSCSLAVHTDPRLLEQMIRNLLSNAFKYTKDGKVLLGCRRHAGSLSIEVLDTGIGIAESELNAIFEEYHQVGNAARERDQGLGLGLAIVQQLGKLLGHRLSVRSLPDRGSVFTIDVALATNEPVPVHHGQVPDEKLPGKAQRGASILVVEDDPDVRDLLELLLKSEGYHPIVASDGMAALEVPMHLTDRPDLILADFNLPKGLNGIELTAAVREKIGEDIPAILLTGDISTATLREIAEQNCLYVSKPVKAIELSESIAALLAAGPGVKHSEPVPAQLSNAPDAPTIYIVDDDSGIRAAIRSVLELEGQKVESYSSCEDFLSAFKPGANTCLLIDSRLPGMQGIELLQKLRAESNKVPAIMITGNGDVATAVQAMKAGAQDFIEKPVGRDELLASIQRALAQSRDAAALSAWQENAARQLSGLTSRQRQIMDLVLAGQPSKNIAADLGISQRTVENHRAAVMKRTGSKSLPALARLAIAAAEFSGDGTP